MDGLHNGAARSKFRVHALAREVSQNLKSLTQRSKEAIKAGPLRWAVVDSVGGTKPANPCPGLGSSEERHQVACFSSVGVVGAAARRPALPRR